MNMFKKTEVRFRIKLRLYVAGQTRQSLAAIANLKSICMGCANGQCHVEVIDLEKNPALARDNQILVVPTLIRTFPRPLQKVIGDLSKTEDVILRLKIPITR